ncbi:hypothetical protein B0A48_05019 [Cryoendolithus antarcticus]|uniref:Uncharacterized protein n=1 Tax=Cryoendolithus antarcticus TaxID=1507870 RepID=A0A1V8TDZ4_9PEZI|nr:hypothetical protein B0A48_05019 [Cryoendolithus antarcticus]
MPVISDTNISTPGDQTPNPQLRRVRQDHQDDMASIFTNVPSTPRLFMTQSPMPDDGKLRLEATLSAKLTTTDHKAPARPAKRARRAPRASSEINGLPTRSAATQSGDTSAVRESTEVVDLEQEDDELVVTNAYTIPRLPRTGTRTDNDARLFQTIKVRFTTRLEALARALANIDKHPHDTHELILRGISVKISELSLVVPKDLEQLRTLYSKRLVKKLDQAEKFMQWELDYCSELRDNLSAQDQGNLDDALFDTKKANVASMKQTRIWFTKLDRDLAEFLAALP